MGRRKPIQACSRCQKRKIKCDRTQPCAACLGSSPVAVCVYEEQDSLKNVKENGTFKVFGLSQTSSSKNRNPSFLDVRHREQFLETVRNNLYTSSKERIDFRYRPTLPLPGEPEGEASGPLEWSFIEKKDPALHMLLRFIRQSKPKNLTLNLLIDETEEKFGSKKESCKKLLTFQQKAQNVLPFREATWSLINIFFRHLYVYFPFLDERSFTSEISRIIGSENSQEQTITLSISKYDDYAYIGILLVLLRMAYLLLKLKSEISQKLAVNIDSATIEVATSSLNEYNITDGATVVKLQCGLYLKLYKRIAPEFGEGIREERSGISTSMLVQMAYSLGFNKETKNIGRRELTLRIKLWHILVIYDMVDAYTIGTPMISNNFFYDVQPFDGEKLDNSSSNSVLLEEEKLALQMFSYLRCLLPLLNKILVLVWNLREGTKLSVFLKALNKLENVVMEKFGSFLCYLTSIQDDLSVNNVCMKSHKAKILLFIKTILLSLYMHLVMFYEEKCNSALKIFYEEKSQVTINMELMPAIKLLSDDMAFYFGSGILNIATFFLQMINRAHLLNISMYIKLKYHLYHYREIYLSREETALPNSYLEEAIQNLEVHIRFYEIYV